MKKRVVVTGIGVVSPLGIGIDSFWENLLACESGIKPITRFDTSNYKAKLGAEIEDLHPEDYIGKKGLRYLNNGTKFLSSTTKMALDDSGLSDNESLYDDLGIVVGSSLGNFAETTDYFYDVIKEGPDDVSPMKSYDVALNSSINHASVFFKTKAFARTISSGFTSSLDAIGDGFRMIQNGKAKAVIVGGVEHLSIDLYMIFYLRNQLSFSDGNVNESSIPFDKRRNGFVLGEGSYLLMLEDYEFAKERGASIYCEIAGYMVTLGANSKFSIARKIKKAEIAMGSALEDAGVGKEKVDFISANANSGKELDMIEATAIRNLFYKDDGSMPIVNAIKASIGENYGASGAAQTVATAMTLKSGNIPPIINYEEKDSVCDLNLAIGQSVNHPVETAMVNSFDYLGNNSCLVLKQINS
ncbi:MAG: beta-ketoacyl-[acyl-carrier-protein] synthase family protein [Candidatus Anammoxibacter sp.]